MYGIATDAGSSARRLMLAVVALGGTLTLGACTAPDAATEADSGEMAGMEQAQQVTEVPAVARVFFIEPQDGATVTSPVMITFGNENFSIEPVGDGEIHQGAGHYHIGVNTDCLEPGIVIPQGEPWIHFGDGSSKIDLQLPPGEATLCLQVGDGEHRTLEGEGMSEVITIDVVEGDQG